MNHRCSRSASSTVISYSAPYSPQRTWGDCSGVEVYRHSLRAESPHCKVLTLSWKFSYTNREQQTENNALFIGAISVCTHRLARPVAAPLELDVFNSAASTLLYSFDLSNTWLDILVWLLYSMHAATSQWEKILFSSPHSVMVCMLLQVRVLRFVRSLRNLAARPPVQIPNRSYFPDFSLRQVHQFEDRLIGCSFWVLTSWTLPCHSPWLRSVLLPWPSAP